MFNSAGNKGNLHTSGKVKPFEVLGKWFGRYVMWQLEFANNLFIAKGGILGPTQIRWDSLESTFVLDADILNDDEDNNDEDYQGADDASGSDDDLDAFTAEDMTLCDSTVNDVEARHSFRKRALSM